MENKGDTVLTLNGGILEYDGLLDSLLNNGYTITINKVGACLYLNYIFKSDELRTEDYCDSCNHKGCKVCISDSLNPYCVPSNYESYTERNE